MGLLFNAESYSSDCRAWKEGESQAGHQGGAGSLGLESARLLLKEGAKVMLVDNNQAIVTQALAALGGMNV